MNGLPNVIDISDGEDDGSDTSSLYDFGHEFLEHDNEIENELRAMEVGHQNQTRPNGTQNLFDSYQSCLHDILEVFPDISHDYVQQLYNKQTESVLPQEDTVTRTLIDKILDTGAYPKEKDRIRELKRKRNDNDEEEAAKWKYMDLRDNPAEYAKVAYV